MLASAKKIRRYTENLDFESFLQDDKTIDATVRNFEILGEAAGRIDDDFKTPHPQIEWRRIKGLRNRVIHEYFGVDYSILWEIIQSDIELLIDFLEDLMNKK